MKHIFRLFIVVIIALVGSAFALAQEESAAAGDTILLQGQVTDTKGTPIEGAVVEIWHTDVNGNYNHPNDADPSVLLDDFQYFGTATTDENGYYAFLTIKPLAYDGRPTHIHFKVKIDGETVLTSQFYFTEERDAVERDGAFRGGDDTLFLSVAPYPDAEGQAQWIATGNIVLDLNGSDANTLAATASQTEGPYYPVVDFSGYDNNLLNATTDDAPVQPMLETAGSPFTLWNLNTATGDDFLTIPNMSSRMVREFEEYRPYVSILQFRREIGKYVDDATVAGYEQYVYVPVDYNASDAATLMQIPGVDEAAANALIAGRPYDSRDAFLSALAEQAPGVDVHYAANYLAEAES